MHRLQKPYFTLLDFENEFVQSALSLPESTVHMYVFVTLHMIMLVIVTGREMDWRTDSLFCPQVLQQVYACRTTVIPGSEKRSGKQTTTRKNKSKKGRGVTGTREARNQRQKETENTSVASTYTGGERNTQTFLTRFRLIRWANAGITMSW